MVDAEGDHPSEVRRVKPLSLAPYTVLLMVCPNKSPSREGVIRTIFVGYVPVHAISVLLGPGQGFHRG